METINNLEKRIGNHLDNGNFVGEIKSPSKRNFLKGLLSAAILGPAALKTQDARAQSVTYTNRDWQKELPPGIEQCRDLWVRRIYAFYQGNINITNAALQMFGSRTPREGAVLNSSWFVEPAVYFTAHRGNSSPEAIPPDHIRNVMGTTPQMAFFSHGIIQYISFWDVKRRYWSSNGRGNITLSMRHDPRYVDASFKSVEENFVNSIFCCAYPGGPLLDKWGDVADANKGEITRALDKAAEFLAGSIEQRTKMADEVAAILHDMGKSEEPKADNEYDSPYNRNLCALWSSVWLVNHYNYGHKGDNIYVAYDHIEKPIRRYMKGIRGSPYYYDSEGKAKV